jgi:hypothetical protein
VASLEFEERIEIVSRLTLQLVASLLVVPLLSVLDVGTRASAAFVSIADTSTSSSAMRERSATELPAKPHVEFRHFWDEAFDSGGGMSSSGPNTSTSDGGAFAALSPRPALRPAASEYFREQSCLFVPPFVIDSLLDPPRPA